MVFPLLADAVCRLNISATLSPNQRNTYSAGLGSLLIEAAEWLSAFVPLPLSEEDSQDANDVGSCGLNKRWRTLVGFFCDLIVWKSLPPLNIQMGYADVSCAWRGATADVRSWGGNQRAHPRTATTNW